MISLGDINETAHTVGAGRPRGRKGERGRGQEEGDLHTLDIMNWNVAGARLQHLRQGLGARPGVLLLQEVRVPAESTWSSSHGYMAFYQDREKKVTGVAISVRHDILKRHKVELDKVERHYMQISIGVDVGKRKIGVVYIPRTGAGTAQRA